MATVNAGMTMSLDGFVSDPQGSASSLYPDLADLSGTDYMKAAGERVVQVVGGASVVQQLLNAGLVDELHVDVMPVILGGGLRLVENIDPERIRLEKVSVQEVGARTSFGFRVVKR